MFPVAHFGTTVSVRADSEGELLVRAWVGTATVACTSVGDACDPFTDPSTQRARGGPSLAVSIDARRVRRAHAGTGRTVVTAHHRQCQAHARKQPSARTVLHRRPTFRHSSRCRPNDRAFSGGAQAPSAATRGWTAIRRAPVALVRLVGKHAAT